MSEGGIVWGCPECLRELREENQRLRIALEGVLPFVTGNYWAGVESDNAVQFAIAAARKPETLNANVTGLAPAQEGKS